MVRSSSVRPRHRRRPPWRDREALPRPENPGSMPGIIPAEALAIRSVATGNETAGGPASATTRGRKLHTSSPLFAAAGRHRLASCCRFVAKDLRAQCVCQQRSRSGGVRVSQVDRWRSETAITQRPCAS